MESASNKPPVFRQFLFDPLLHFVVIGFLVFVLYSQVSGTSSPDAIILPEGEVLEFISEYRARLGQEPDQATVEEFRRNWLSEEVLFQEGVRLGLIFQDPVVRQRIVNKMQLVFAEEAPTQAPDDDSLRAYLSEVQDRYSKPARFSFEVALLSGSSLADPQERVSFSNLLLRALNNGAKPELTGVPYQVHREKNAAAVRALWGEEFATALTALRVEDGWRALDSTRGPVLVKLTGVEQSQVPPFEELKDNLLIDWQRQQRVAAVQQKVAELRKSYQVTWQAEQ